MRFSLFDRADIGPRAKETEEGGGGGGGSNNENRTKPQGNACYAGYMRINCDL